MKYLDVSEDYVKSILKLNNLLEEDSKIEVSAEAEETQEEIVEEATEEVHACPLCESELDEALPDSALQECIDFILDTLNETQEEDGEALSEDEEAEEQEN